MVKRIFADFILLLIMILFIALCFGGCSMFETNPIHLHQTDYGTECLIKRDTTYAELALCQQKALTNEHNQNKLVNEAK